MVLWAVTRVVLRQPWCLLAVGNSILQEAEVFEFRYAQPKRRALKLSCFIRDGLQYGPCLVVSFQRGFASLDSPPSPAGASEASGCKRRQGRGPEAAAEAKRRERVRTPGEAFTLDASGSHIACRPRVKERGGAAGPAPAASPARTDAGCNRRGCSSGARRYLPADRKKASRRARPVNEGGSELPFVDGAASSWSPVLAQDLQDVLAVGWVPQCVTCNHVIAAASRNHHAGLHVTARGLRIRDIASSLRHVLERDGFERDAARQSGVQAAGLFQCEEHDREA